MRCLAAVAAAMLVAACGGSDPVGGNGGAALEVSSTVLRDGGTVPTEHTCDGADTPPDLAWGGVPADAVEIVVVVDDPDAPGGTFTHWTAWGLAPGDTPLQGGLPPGAVEGTNDFGEVGYRGPCPPAGDEPHRYRFRVLALDSELGLPPGAGPGELAAAVEGHVIAEGTLTATYGR